MLENSIGAPPEATLDDVPRERAVRYSGRDADTTFRIKPVLWDMVVARGLEGCYRMDLATVPMINRMQHVGMKVDVSHFHKLEKELTAGMKREQWEIISMIRGLPEDFNPNSPDQTADLLFRRLGLKSKHKTPTRKDSTNDKVLEALRSAHPVVPHIIDYRELGTMRDDFCIKIPRMVGGDGRIHCTIRITRVSSGRLSATGPNLLGIPVRTALGKKIREGFVSTDGCVMVGIDLDQIEMREMAYQSKDENMIRAFVEGRDIHRQTGAMVFGKRPEDVTAEERYASKRIGFGVITGIQAEGLLQQMELAGAEGWDLIRCEQAIQGFMGYYKGVRAYLEECRAEARRYGYVRDRWGRIRYLPGVHSDIPRVRSEAERQSHSFKISASAQGTLKHAMKAIWDNFRGVWGNGMEPLLQIHDELLFEMKKEIAEDGSAIEEIQDLMCYTTGLGQVPIKAKSSIGTNWGMLKD